MMKRGALQRFLPVLVLLILITFVFLSSSVKFTAGPTGLEVAWVGFSNRVDAPANQEITVDLAQYFTSDKPLTFVVTQADSIRTGIDGSILRITPSPGFIGERAITVYAYDGESVLRQRFKIIVGETLTVEAAGSAAQPVVAASQPATQAPVEKVEPELEAALASQQDADAIIILKETTPFAFSATANKQLRQQLLEQRRQRIDQLQDAFAEKVDSNQITGAVITENDLEITREYDTVNALAVRLTRAGLEALRNDPSVERVLLDRPFQAFRAQSIPLVSADDVWQMQGNATNLTGAGETICIIDTGLDLTHPAFAGKIVGGHDYYNNDADAQDDNNHGTHVAGIALGNDSTKGVAPDAKVVPVKVCSSTGSCSGSAILAGIDYCNNNSITFNITAISGSLGDNAQYTSANCPSLFESGLNTSVSLGIIPVFASGNNGYTGGVSYPACSPNAISVGAVSKSDGLESYTNRGGDRLDALAPGTSVTSTFIGGGTGTMSGTSMATPHVSGIIALVQQSQKARGKPVLTLAEMRQLLKETGKQASSWHRADAYAAIVRLEQNFSINLTENSVTNITPPKAKVQFKESTDFNRFVNCSQLKHNFIHVDSENCPQFNKSAHIVLEGLAGINATPLRNGEPCPPDTCQNATFVNGTLEFDVVGFSNYSGNSSFDIVALVSGCALINQSTDLSANVASNQTCFTVNASNLYLNCSGFSITHNVNGSPRAAAIEASNQRNITIQDCVITDVNASGTLGYGIRFTNVNDSRIVNTTVQTNGTGDTNHAIFLFRNSHRNTVANNTLRALGTGTDNYGVAIVESNFNNITGNTIFTNGTLGNYGMIANDTSTGSRISFNSIFTNSSNNQSNGESANHGLSVESGSHNITDNNISTDGFGYFNQGVSLFLINSNTIARNRVTTSGGVRNNLGIALSASSTNIISNNTITGRGLATNNGIAFFAGSDANVLDGNNITTTGNSSYAVALTSGTNSRFTNTVLSSPVQWIESFAVSTGNNFTNTTFAAGNGSMRFPGSFVPAGLVNVTQQRLNVSQNRAFLNSTNLSVLNTSAEVSLFGITTTDPLPMVDLDDDGAFTFCASCTETGFAGSAFAFNVPSFTSYSSSEGGVTITLTKTDSPDPMNASSELNYTITVNVTVGNASNITLTDIYPAQAIFIRSSPANVSGNNTFVVGNLTAGQLFSVNITVLVNNGTNNFAITNTANISFTNATGGRVGLNVTESTTVVGSTPPPPAAGGSGGAGGGGGSSKPKKEETPLPPPVKPALPVLPRTLTPQTTRDNQETHSQVTQETAPEAESPSLVEQIASADAAARENAITAAKRKKLFAYIFYSVTFSLLVALTVYWFAMHHRKQQS